MRLKHTVRLVVAQFSEQENERRMFCDEAAAESVAPVEGSMAD